MNSWMDLFQARIEQKRSAQVKQIMYTVFYSNMNKVLQAMIQDLT